VLGYALFVLLFFLGLLSKENVVTLPAVLLLAELTLFRASVGLALRRGAVIAALTGPALVSYFIVTHLFHDQGSLTTQGILEQLQSHFTLSGITPWEMVLTECRVLFSYLATIIAPLPGHVLLCKAEVISRSLTQPPVTLVACAGALGLAVIGVALVRRAPVVAFGTLYFLTALIPESVLIPHYLYFGYRAILPMLGVLLVGAWAVRRLIARTEASRVPLRLLVWTLGVAIAAYLAVVTYTQAARWDPVRFWAQAHAALPPISRDLETVPLLDILGNYGEALVDSGDYQRAIQTLEMALTASVPWEARQPADGAPSQAGPAPADRMVVEKSEGLRILLGKAYRKSGRISDAIALFQRELKRFPQSAALHNSLGLALAESGRVADAIQSYRQAIAIRPGLAEAHNNLGAAYRDSGALAEAVAQFRRAIEVDPRFALAHLNLGLALMDEGNPREARLHCLRAVELNPRSATAYGALGRVLEASGKSDLAVRSYRAAARLDPMSARAYLILGDALFRTAAYDEAAESYRHALSLKPESVEARANLALALVRAGKAAEATTALQEALDAGADHPDFHNMLGIALAAQGQLPKAIAHFERALKLAPNHHGARRNLESALEQQKKGTVRPDGETRPGG